MHNLDLERLQACTVTEEPFPYFYLQQAIDPSRVGDIIADFPPISKGGSFNPEDLPMSDQFQQFLAAFDSSEFRRIIGEKFDIDVMELPMMLTLRGYSRAKDGRIHTDSTSKVVTILVYLNASWEATSGRLRLLHNGTDMDDYFEELVPGPGTLLAFKVTDNCWHGYPSYEGKRQAIQINFLSGDGANSRHRLLHKLSARVKSLFS